jgi:cytoskeletal protein CcmA (bactofilin family)
MFRRKEDSLFDNTTDPNDMDTQDSAAVVSQPSSSAPASSISSSSSSSPSSTPAYLGSSQPSTASASRVAEPRTAPQPASSFRPSAPAAPAASPAADLTRSRMPEPKPSSPTPPSPASAFSVSGSKPVKRVLTVGNDILLKGEIATCDRLVIEGKVDATLNDVHTVEIAETGSFKGAAHIEDAEISGLFEGDLIVRNRLVIYATGKVRGKISYGEIEIERGGELTGEIKTSNPGSQTSSARPARQPKEDKVAA